MYIRGFTKGPFKYYVIKKVGGWVWPNAYVSLQVGWVGVGKYLRNELLELQKKDFILNLTDLYNLSWSLSTKE